MERSRFAVWARRIALLLALVLVTTGAAVVWRTMSLIESDLLSPGAIGEPVELEVVGVAGSRVLLKDTPDASREGVWGVVGPNGYAQMTRVTATGPSGIERGFAVLSGTFEAGDIVTLDAAAFPDDPRASHGLPFEEVRVPGELGVNPAWLITGEADTWVIFVHGKREDGRLQALRSLPTFRKLGFPVLVITYRNDASGGAADDQSYRWGLDEWRDLEAAIDTATLRGASDFVLVGHDMGASVISMFLHESERASAVRGVILDSAILDPEALVDDLARDRGIPGYLSSLGKAVSRVRFGLEWSELDQVERVGEFDPNLPMLLMHGSADAVAPLAVAEEFAASLPEADLEVFDGAGHGALWNVESVRYEEVLTAFLSRVIPESLTEG